MSFITNIEARGEARGRRDVLLRQLGLRFPPLSDETKAKVLAADDATLDRWVDRVITAPSLEAVLAD